MQLRQAKTPAGAAYLIKNAAAGGVQDVYKRQVLARLPDLAAAAALRYVHHRCARGAVFGAVCAAGGYFVMNSAVLQTTPYV